MKNETNFKEVIILKILDVCKYISTKPQIITPWIWNHKIACNTQKNILSGPVVVCIHIFKHCTKSALFRNKRFMLNLMHALRGTLFPQFLDFILFGAPKRYIIISHSQKIFQICFTISVESSITFLNLVQAVLNWAVGRSKTGNRTLYEMPRAKSKYVPWLGDFSASFWGPE